MRLCRSRDGYAVSVSDGLPATGRQPSVDLLFESVAREACPDVIAIVLSGMGRDGANGILEVRRSGGLTIAQDEATSIAFGMPRDAIETGAIEYVMPLARIPDALAASLQLLAVGSAAGPISGGAGRRV
jgi:two-component system chemotaxis response regulator CheB